MDFCTVGVDAWKKSLFPCIVSDCTKFGYVTCVSVHQKSCLYFKLFSLGYLSVARWVARFYIIMEVGLTTRRRRWGAGHVTTVLNSPLVWIVAHFPVVNRVHRSALSGGSQQLLQGAVGNSDHLAPIVNDVLEAPDGHRVGAVACHHPRHESAPGVENKDEVEEQAGEKPGLGERM